MNPDIQKKKTLLGGVILGMLVMATSSLLDSISLPRWAMVLANAVLGALFGGALLYFGNNNKKLPPAGTTPV